MPELPKHITIHLDALDYANALVAARSRIVAEYRYHEQRLQKAPDPRSGFGPRVDAQRAVQAAAMAGAIEILKELMAKRRGAPSADVEAILTRVVEALTPPAAPDPAPAAAPPPDRHPTEKD